MRLHSVSLYDEQANCLWLSEGALGPDEHNLVLDALDVLANDKSLPCYENGVEDGRVAIFLPIRAPQGDLVGVVMILADLKSVGDGVLEKIVSPQVRPIIQKVAVLMRAARPGAEPSAPVSVPVASVLELTPERPPTPTRPAAPAPQATAAAKATAPAAKPAVPNGKLNGAHPTVVPAGDSLASRSVAPAAAPSRPAVAPISFMSPAPVAPAATAAPAGDSLAGRSVAPPTQDLSLSPQAIDDILEFELFPEGAPPPPHNRTPQFDEELVPMSPASSFQQSDSLSWDVTGSALQLLDDSSALPPIAEPVKPVVAPTPARSAGAATPAKPAAPQVQAPPPVAAIPVIAPVNLAPPVSRQAPVSVQAPAVVPVLQAPVLQPPTVAPAGGSFVPAGDSLAGRSVAGRSVAPVLAAAAASTAAVVPAGDSLVPAEDSLAGRSVAHTANPTPVAVAIDLAPPAALLNAINGNSTPAAAAAAAQKSTGATTTTKALGSAAAATGTARALNGSGSTTANVQALTSATQTSRTIALDPSNLILDVQPFSKLRAGGRMRRYEVLPRIPHRDANRAPAATDGLALQRLLSWLGSNRSAWNLEPTSFSLNLSISTLEDERFPQQVAQALKANGIAPDNLGFEIAEPLCTQRRAQVERFMTLCDKLGCFVVIDDFSFDSSILPLLRSKALRLVKIDPKLTSAALKDKLSQAMVVAIVQAVKVLGIHCAAKRVESQASLQWLTAIGCDLAQGPALSQVLPIESLNMPQPPPAEAGKAS
jgi:EAL domain-containing protein (putative c-di-GMP-specific phosphodiesterase class I)